MNSIAESARARRAGLPRVVVVGAGFGGLAVVRELEQHDVDVIVVDRNNYHTFQPLLYQVATAGLEPEEIAHAVRAMHRGAPRVEFRMDEVRGLDLDQRRVLCAHSEPIPYDQLVLALGSVTNDFGVEGVARHAFGLKTLDDAVRLRNHVLAQFERVAARARAEPGELTFTVVGGGPTGVEMAGALVELIERVLRKDYPRLDFSAARVVLIERETDVLGAFAPPLRAYGQRELEKRGVELRTKASVRAATAEWVELDKGERIPTHTLVWAAGVRAHPLGATLGLPTTHGGRLAVEPDLAVPGRPEISVIGDLAGSCDASGRLLPQLAPVAMRGGRHAARMILRRIEGRATEPFVYVDRGTMATIGRNAAVAQFGANVIVRGRIAWWAWLVLHLVQLIGFRNRVNVLVNWAWNYCTYDRSARLILGREVRADAPRDSDRVEAPRQLS